MINTDEKTRNELLQNLQGRIAEYKEARADSSCDKYEFAFQKDYGNSDVWKASIGAICFTSHLGYYGNSSCHQVISLSEKESSAFCEYLVMYLNNNFNSIMSGVIALLKEDSASYRKKLITEMKQKISELEKIDEQAPENKEASK